MTSEKNLIYHKKSAQPVIGLFTGERNGKQTGKQLNIVLEDAEVKNSRII